MSIATVGLIIKNIIKAAPDIYSEDFTTTIFYDQENTTADWSTSIGQVSVAKEWVKSDGTKTYYENISRELYTSRNPAVVVNNSNQPYIFWENDTTGSGSYDYYFTRGNLIAEPADWQKMDGISGWENISSNPAGGPVNGKMAIDLSDKPYFVWQEANDIFFSYWTGSAWRGLQNPAASFDNLSQSAVLGYTASLPQISIDQWDRVFVAWQGNTATSNEIMVTMWDKLNPANSKWSSITGKNYCLHGSNDGTVCTDNSVCTGGGICVGYENISKTDKNSANPRLAIGTGSLPYPQLIWIENNGTYNQIVYSKWTYFSNTAFCGNSQYACWTNMAGTVKGFENISQCATFNCTYTSSDNFKLDSNGFPQLIWHTGLSSNTRLNFIHWDGSLWSGMAGLPGREIPDPTPIYNNDYKLAINQDDYPQLVFSAGSTRSALLFIHWNGSAWTGINNVPGVEVVRNFPAREPKIVVDNNNQVNLLWLDDSVDDGLNYFNVYFTKSNNNVWTRYSGSGNCTVGGALCTSDFDCSGSGYCQKIGFDNLSNTAWNNNNPNIAMAENGNLYVVWSAGDLSYTFKPEINFTYLDSVSKSWSVLRPGAESTTTLLGEKHSYATSLKIATSPLAPYSPYMMWEDDCSVSPYPTISDENQDDVCFMRWDGNNWVDMNGNLGNEEVTDNFIERRFFSKYYSPFRGSNNLLFDSLGNPYLIWVDQLSGSNNKDLNLTKWNGSSWVNMDNQRRCVYGVNAGNVCLLDRDCFDDLDLAVPRSLTGDGRCISDLCDGGVSDGYVCSRDLECMDKLNDGYCTGVENISNDPEGNYLITGDYYSHQAAVIDSADNLYLVWPEETSPGNPDDIFFTKWNGFAWVNMDGVTLGKENISNSAKVSYKPIIVFDNLANPYIIWQESPIGTYLLDPEVWLTHWDSGTNSWKSMDLSSSIEKIDVLAGGRSTINEDSVQFDGSNRPNILYNYYDAFGNYKVFFLRWDGSSWVDMAGTGSYDQFTNFYDGQLKFDSSYNPHIVMVDEINRLVKFTRWFGGQWSTMAGSPGIETIIENTEPYSAPIWELDTFDRPRVFWMDETEGYAINARDVFYTQWNGSDWVDVYNNPGYTNITHHYVAPMLDFDVVKDGNDNLHLINNKFEYNVNLYYSKLSVPTDYYRIVQSSDVYPGPLTDIVKSATLTTVTDNAGGNVTINYAVSNDYGNTWLPAPLGTEIVFNSAPTLKWRAYLKTTNETIVPTINDLTINYSTLAPPVGLYCGDGICNNGEICTSCSADCGICPPPPIILVTPAGTSDTICWDSIPEDPSDVVLPVLPCTATSPSAISWNFTDNAVCEAGYRLYDAATDIRMKYVEQPNLSTIEETGLATNIQYSRYVTAYNAAGESGSNTALSCFTLAKVPNKPIILSANENEIILQIDPNDGNPVGTEYEIKELLTNQFVQADGTFGSGETWQTYAAWGGDSGLAVIGELPAAEQPLYEEPSQQPDLNAAFHISLTAGQNYSFAVQAKNGDGIPTGFSSATGSTSGPTGPAPVLAPIITAAKGVAINLVRNSNYNVNIFAAALAESGFGFNANTSKTESLLREFSLILNLLILILLGFLSGSIISSFSHLGKDLNWQKRLKLLGQMFVKEPAVMFSEQAQPDKNGIYQISFEKHKQSQLNAQKHVKRALGLIAIKAVVLVTLLTGLAGVNHLGKAQTAPYDQSGTAVNVGDKLSYIIEISNSGTAAANDAVVMDTIDSNLENFTVTGIINCGTYTDKSTATVLNVDGVDVAEASTCVITYTAKVKTGTEGNTITNQALALGPDFATVTTNITINSINAAPALVCGNNKLDPGEQCDPTGCASDERCVSCRCQPIPPAPVCGNSIVETGEQCDNSACGADQICSNCACQSVIPPIPPVIPPPVTPPGTLPPGTLPPGTPPGTLPPSTPPGIPLITPIISSISGAIDQILPEQLKAILDNPQVEQTSQNIVTPILIALALLNTVPLILALSIYLLPYLHLLFLEPLLILFGKKRKKWGVVYNALTKIPIDLALVRLYRKNDNMLVQTRVTDKEGRYIIIAKEPGKYYLSVTKPGFISPTRYLKDEKQDTKYLDLYHGEVIEVTEKDAVITANIPLDPAEKMVLPIKEVVRSYLLKNLRLIISYIGMVLALLIVIIYPTVITIGALILHVILFLIFRRMIVPAKPKRWGIVYDAENKAPLHQAIVRIFDTRFNKLLETQVTDRNGRYAFLVGKNEYQLLTEKEGYKPKEVKPVDLVKNEEIVNLDLGLSKN